MKRSALNDGNGKQKEMRPALSDRRMTRSASKQQQLEEEENRLIQEFPVRLSILHTLLQCIYVCVCVCARVWVWTLFGSYSSYILVSASKPSINLSRNIYIYISQVLILVLDLTLSSMSRGLMLGTFLPIFSVNLNLNHVGLKTLRILHRRNMRIWQRLVLGLTTAKMYVVVSFRTPLWLTLL